MSGKLAPAGGLAVADGEDAVGEELAQPVQPVLEPARARWIAASVLHDALFDLADREDAEIVRIGP